MTTCRSRFGCRGQFGHITHKGNSGHCRSHLQYALTARGISMVDRLVTCGSLDPPFTSLHHTFEAARSPGLLIPRSSIVFPQLLPFLPLALPSRIYLHLKISHPGFRLTGNPLDAMDFPNFVSSVCHGTLLPYLHHK